MKNLPFSDDYKSFLENIKTTIRSSQIRAALAVNETMLRLYWEIGKSIVFEQERLGWGAAVIDQLSKDLKREFPDMDGFSRTNVFYFRQFYVFYRNASEKVQQLVGQIPWGHNILIFRKIKDLHVAEFYLKATIENGWSRNILDLQIDTKLHERQGKSINNFSRTLPSPQSELAEQTLKDPYIFSFLTLEKDAHELDMERQLVKHVVDLLLEMGTGFAFVGRQFRIEIGEKTYSIDLLFYNYRLKCFFIVDLKMKDFEPEFAGKMNFYLSGVDDQLRGEGDGVSIGIILCKSKNHIEVEYALRDLNKPVGVSEFYLTNVLPESLQSTLPSVEDLERELNERLMADEEE
jgi:predicted nuclease of restriction endonuclease-like (RecB) superfamily